MSPGECATCSDLQCAFEGADYFVSVCDLFAFILHTNIVSVILKQETDMAVKEKKVASERAYQQAMEIIDREWMAAGVTEEELKQEAQLAEIFDRLIGSGRSVDDVRAEWEVKTIADILREYSALPRQ